MCGFDTTRGTLDAIPETSNREGGDAEPPSPDIESVASHTEGWRRSFIERYSEGPVAASLWDRSHGGIWSSVPEPPLRTRTQSRSRGTSRAQAAGSWEGVGDGAEQVPYTQEWYCFTIIDFLQRYNIRKKAEHVAKVSLPPNISHLHSDGRLYTCMRSGEHDG